MSEKIPTFRQIQQWSWRRKKNAGTVYDAAKHFDVPEKTIVEVVVIVTCGADGPNAKEQYFEHDGE